jgi:predicted TIM-barrel fold metal-dependent hydrolase
MTSTYAAGRRIVDIDAHILEPKGWLRSYASAAVQDQIPELGEGDSNFNQLLDDSYRDYDQRKNDEILQSKLASEFMSMPRKGWMSLGGWDVDERRQALDLLGFDCQLIFPTGSFEQIMQTPTSVRLEAVRAMNRGMLDFCQDPRLLASAYVPFEFGPEIALELIAEAVTNKVTAVLIDSIPASHQHSFTHPDFDAVWEALQDSNLAVFLHVGADQNYRPVPKVFFDNGRDMRHFRSDAPGDPLSYMAIGYPGELFLASLVYDGILEKFPKLRIGITELGATWLPSFLHFIDTGFRAFKSIQDLSHLSMRPSDYLRRHVVVSPFAGEDVGWIIEQAGAQMVAFSSDYPHHEGTDDPIRRFEASMPNVVQSEYDHFYFENGVRLLGL